MKRKVNCGGVIIGGDAPVSIQSMTNTNTADVKATVEQIRRLEDAGCQIIRLAVPDLEAAYALKQIKAAAHVPIVADIHFDYRLALESMRSGVDKIRINPGNIGSEDGVRQIVQMAKERHIPISWLNMAESQQKGLPKAPSGMRSCLRSTVSKI